MKKTLQMLILAALFVLLGFSSFAQPSVVAVDDSWVGTTPGTTVYYNSNPYTFGTDAFDNIVAGLGAVAAGGTVHVADGNYPEPAFTISKSLTLDGESEAGVIIDASGATASNNYIDIYAAVTVILKDFTVDANIPHYTSWPPPKPFYGINIASANPQVTINNVTIEAFGKNGLNINGGANISVTDLASLNNGGAGIFMTDVNDITLTNTTTDNNQWGAVCVATWGRYFPLGTDDVIFAGTNSFGEATSSANGYQGGLYLEMGNYSNKANPAMISYSTNPADNANVTLVPGDFNYTLHGPQDDGNPVTSDGYIRIRFYDTRNDAALAAVQADDLPLHVTGPGHFLMTGRYVKEMATGDFCVFNGMAIQPAIDAAASAGIINVFPGTYSETASGRYLYDNQGPYQFGLFLEEGKDDLTVRGVDATGAPITSYGATQATVNTNATNGFGPSGIFVEGNGITISGLKIGTNSAGQNKTVEVIGDDFSLLNCDIIDFQGSIYLNDWRFDDGTDDSYVESYTIQGNMFRHGVSLDVASGPGYTGPVSGRVITGNIFNNDPDEYWPSISFSGSGTGVPWFTYPVGGAVITGNTFVNLDEISGKHIRARGTYDEADFDWASYWNNNTFNKAVIVGINPPADIRTYSYTSGTYTFNSVRQIGAVIQVEADHALPGDKILAKAGTYTEQLTIATNNLTIEGAGKSNTFIKSPAALTNYFTSSENNYPIVYVNGVANFTLKNLTVDGDGKGNGNYRFTGIGFYNAGGTVLNVDVKNIWETPFSGNQHGNGVYSFSDAGGPYTIACKNMVIENYQKNGMALLGNAVLDIDNVTTIGEGATAVTAQNGIQAGPLTTGLIKNCDVRDDQYTGGYWTASGIILDGDVDVQNTDITGCQTSIYAIDGDNDLSHLDITAPLVYLEEAYGIIVYSTPAARSGSELPQPSPFDGLGNGAGRATNMTFNLTQSKLTGNYETGSIGVYLFSENGLTANINKCNIGNWDYGIYAEGYGTGTVTATVNKCNLSGNNYGFVNIPGGTREDADGTENWWGDDSGPYNPTTNPGGLGSEVSDFIDYQDWLTDPVDISIFNNECGVLEVMAVPSMPLNGQVTNILFAVKWTGASYPDVFQSIQSDYNVNLQYYATDGAFKYAVFGTDLTAINWQALVGDTILTLTLKQNQPEGTTGDFEIGDDAWTAANNADYYFEFWGSDLTGLITGFADDVYLASCDLQLHLKAFLQGPYNTTTNLMNVDLTVNGPIPLSQPFEGAPWNYDGTETLASLPADMVDWVLVELRPTPAGTPIRQAGLLFKDGTVRSHLNPAVDIYYTDEFMPNADYYAALFHRNHMPVMSAAAVNVPNAGDRYDFSNMTLYPAYGGATAQVLLESGVHGMITGDVNKDGDLIYSGASNDRALILQRIVLETGNSYINGVTQGYYDEDLTMNSWVKYSGSGNDQRLIILNLIDLTGTYNLNATYASLVPGYGAKALHVSPGTGPLDIALEESAYELRVVMMTRDYIAEGWTDNIQFTLSWDEKNTRMDQVVKNTASAYGLAPQGEVAIQDGRRYQVFAMVDWFALPQPFVPGEKVTLLSLDKGSFSGTDMKAAIAGDAFTRLHNGEYYVSLAGFDQTGQVLDALTGIGDPNPARAAFSLYPNPASRGFVNLSFMPAADETVVVTVTDLSSRVVAQESFGVSKGQAVVRQISLDGLSKGIYLIRLQGSEFSKTGKLEVQ